MADLFDSRLKLRLQESGSNSGNWGVLLNQTVTNIASVFGFGTHQLTSDADATLTLSDDGASLDALKSSYLKITSSVSLTATRTLTFAPNTFNQVKYIENATSGSQSITISQGSGSSVTIESGSTKVVYFTGAGSGAAVVDALANIDQGTAEFDTIRVSTIKANDGTASSTIADSTGVMTIASAVLTTADINAGTIDSTIIGGSTAAAGTFTSVTADGLTVNAGATLQSSSGATITLKNTTAAAGADALLGAVDFFNSDGSGEGPSVQARIRAATANSIGNGADLEFYTTAASGGSENDPPVKRMEIDQIGDISFFDTSGNAAVHFDASAAALGVGTSVPQTSLAVETSGTQNVVSPIVTGQSSGVTYGGLFTVRDGSGDQRGLAFKVYTANVGLNETFRISSSGSAGIGVVPKTYQSLYNALQVGNTALIGRNGSNESYLSANSYYDGIWKYISSEAASVISQSGGVISFLNAASGTADGTVSWNEAMRISGGNLLVGKTSASGGIAGSVLAATGLTRLTASGIAVAEINRLTNDGSIVDFKKDGQTVGSIQSRAGVVTTIVLNPASGNGAGLSGGTKAVVPADEAGIIDNDISLGVSSHRFSDLFLGGTAQLTTGGRPTTGKGGALIVGGNADSNGLTTNTRKIGLITVPSFDNTDGNMALITGDTNSASSNFIYIGSAYTGYTSPTDIIFNTGSVGTQGSEAMRISGGNLLIGTSTTRTGNNSLSLEASNSLLMFRAANTSSLSQVLFVRDTAGTPTTVGSINTTGSSTTYNTSSDQRLKDNIQDAEDAGELIDAIQVRQFDWKVDGEHQRYGMVAQELTTVAPEAVSTSEDPDEMMGVDYSKLVPMLIKEIQSLRNRVAELEGG